MADDKGGTKEVSVAQFPDNEAELVSIREAGRRLGVCARTVRREIERGRLKGIRVGRSLRIRITELSRYMENQTIGVPA
jgi:excisionase family DNA binding protein